MLSHLLMYFALVPGLSSFTGLEDSITVFMLGGKIGTTLVATCLQYTLHLGLSPSFGLWLSACTHAALTVRQHDSP